jgi:hypothetical protein
MARRSRGKNLADLEGKLGIIRREVLKVLRSLKREIARREEELGGLKAEYAKGEDLVRGRKQPGPARVRRRARRSRQINWKEVFRLLPARFTLKTLARHPLVGGRPKGHLYAILSRWKKEGLLARDPAGGYRKATAQPKPKRRPRRAKPVPARRLAPARKPARAQKPAQQPEGQSA